MSCLHFIFHFCMYKITLLIMIIYVTGCCNKNPFDSQFKNSQWPPVVGINIHTMSIFTFDDNHSWITESWMNISHKSMIIGISREIITLQIWLYCSTSIGVLFFALCCRETYLQGKISHAQWCYDDCMWCAFKLYEKRSILIFLVKCVATKHIVW